MIEILNILSHEISNILSHEITYKTHHKHDLYATQHPTKKQFKQYKHVPRISLTQLKAVSKNMALHDRLFWNQDLHEILNPTGHINTID